MFKEYFKFYKHINSLEQQSNIIDFANEVNTEFMVRIILSITFIYLNKILIYDYSRNLRY